MGMTEGGTILSAVLSGGFLALTDSEDLFGVGRGVATGLGEMLRGGSNERVFCVPTGESIEVFVPSFIGGGAFGRANRD